MHTPLIDTTTDAIPALSLDMIEVVQAKRVRRRRERVMVRKVIDPVTKTLGVAG
jgi:hypothetical protein